MEEPAFDDQICCCWLPAFQRAFLHVFFPYSPFPTETLHGPVLENTLCFGQLAQRMVDKLNNGICIIMGSLGQEWCFPLASHDNSLTRVWWIHKLSHTSLGLERGSLRRQHLKPSWVFDFMDVKHHFMEHGWVGWIPLSVGTSPDLTTDICSYIVKSVLRKSLATWEGWL